MKLDVIGLGLESNHSYLINIFLFNFEIFKILFDSNKRFMFLTSHEINHIDRKAGL